MNELISLVKIWAYQKGILENGTPEKQSLKTLEECGELIQSVAKNDIEEIKDAIGDIMVTLIIQCEMQDLRLKDCLDSAYDVISKRTGKIVNGTFIKD